MKIEIKESNENYNLYVKSVDGKQVFITIANQNKDQDILKTASLLYKKAYEILTKYNITVFHERFFGTSKFYHDVQKIRAEELKLNTQDKCFSYIEGSPYWGEGISGINVHGIILCDEEIKDVEFNGIVCGKLYKTDAVDYMLVHTVHGNKESDYYGQTYEMFQSMIQVLNKYDFQLKNVIRTWIYLDKILLLYDEFNKARTKVFLENGLWSDSVAVDKTEEIYMPASTGISCGNPHGLTVISDVLAIRTKNYEKFKFTSESGKAQKSAMRYGSAFSRAILLDDKTSKSKYVYLSGTASIDDLGNTVYLDDIGLQIDKTYSVIDALLDISSMKLNNMTEGTVFLKKAEYIDAFIEYCKRRNIELPALITVADVCRDNLLFEMDGTFAGGC
ncbi:endoribonuclease L-PSP [Clostridium sp. BNL1100]|uniref:endoribonuclease L-PSP n=1 Tax=Clostridium sp. BNL1100 TaxID=755731 RepID=UPI00024A7A03|nr:endoribonuclease L-PSP [Clostridium sp. BNL1100]AEY64863.1 putative translation initiation inhibitor, yjgF family [Clostridium sp. BNL1100]